MALVSCPSERESRSRDPPLSPPFVGFSAFADKNDGGHSPFDDDPVDEEDAISRHSCAESHRQSRGWIAECLWWLSSFRKRRYQSDYEVLFINGSERFGANSCRLSDPRLRPRLPKLIIILLLLSLGGILCVFFLVSRGITLKEPTISVIEFTVDSVNQSFTLVVNVTIPFHNPNYVSADISGDVQMKYYNAYAGVNNINETISKRHTTNITTKLDSSQLTIKYISTVIQHCFAFPRQEVFFIAGEFKAKYLLSTAHLSFDTYRYIDCPVGHDPVVE